MIDLRLPLSLASGYRSPSQIVRVVTENWTANHVACPACAQHITKAPNNSPGLDFVCASCKLSFELKSKCGPFGNKLVDGAYQSMISKIADGTQSNFFLLSYDREFVVTNLVLVPRRFIVPEIIECRRPLAENARRAGWIGCNLRISLLPSSGKITYVRDKQVISAKDISNHWQHSAFLDGVAAPSRSWLIAVMRCVEKINKDCFNIQEAYEFVTYLQSIFPDNKHVKAKIRQQLQVLRDKGWLRFLGNGKYERRSQYLTIDN